MWSASLLPVTLLVAVLLWPVRWLATRHWSIRSPGDAPVLLLAVMALVTLFITIRPAETRVQVLRLLTGAALYFAILNGIKSKAYLSLLRAGLVALVSILALLAPLAVHEIGSRLFPSPDLAVLGQIQRIFSDSINPNVMAGIIILMAPLGLAWLFFSWQEMSWTLRVGLLGSVALSAWVLMLTDSRGAWLAFVASILLIVFLRWRRGWIAVAVSGLLGSAVIFWIGASRAAEALSHSNAIPGSEVRLEIWSRAVYMIQDFPITGSGMGTFADIAGLLYPLFLSPPGSIPHAHNLFLQVAVDLGVPGLIAWLAVWAVVMLSSWQVWRISRERRDRWGAGLGAGLLAGQFAFGLHGLFDAPLWGMTKPSLLVWVLWGMAVAGMAVYRKSMQTLPDGQPAEAEVRKAA